MEKQSKQNSLDILPDIISELPEEFKTTFVINAIQKLIQISDIRNQFSEHKKEDLKKSLIIIIKEEIKKLKTKSSEHL